MRKAIMVGLMASAAAILCGKAFAADLPVRGQPRAVETYNNYWDGLYIGINGGFGRGTITDANFTSDAATGFLGGLQAGANKQLGSVVIGLVTDFDFGSIDKSGGKLAWIGTTRAKFGVLISPQVLVYGTGGVAYGGVEAQAGVFDIASLKVPTVGWAVGAGAEYAISSNLGLGFEYLHVKLDGPSTVNFNPSADGDLFRGTLNYKF